MVSIRHTKYTIDREIFTLKIICIKIFVVLYFRGFIQSVNFFKVDGYNMDKHLERS